MTYPFNQIPSTNPQNIGVATPVGIQTAARDPTALDNTYVPGSEWQNSVTKLFWKCVSSTISGAVWIPFAPANTGNISTVTGDLGVPLDQIGPDGLGNVNVIGDGVSIVVHKTGMNTLTVSLMGSGGIGAQSIGVDTTSGGAANPVIPTGAGQINFTGASSTYTISTAANTVHTEVQGTNHALFVGRGATTPATTLPAATDGQIPIGVTGADPTLATISAGAGIAITNGPGSISIALTGGGAGVDSVSVQTGISPVTPDGAGLLTINGAVVAAGTNPVKTDGTGANTLAVEVQTSQALAAGDATKIGLCNFDSASFAVSAAGFVTLTAALVGASSFPVDANTAPGTNPVLPTGGGAVTIAGTIVAAQTIPIRTDSLAANTINVEVQRASTSAATNGTQQGMASFNSGQFVVDANGWVSGKAGGIAFYAPLTTSSGGVTGNAGVYTLGNNGGGTTTIVTDTGSNLTFVGGDLTFTVPATGIYLLGICFTVAGITAAMSAANAVIVCSGGRTINTARTGAFQSENNAGQNSYTGSVIIPLTAAETVLFKIQITNGAANTCSMVGTSAGIGDTTYAFGCRIG